jgi:UDP-N-acetylglucosamine 1-carboxyvinyltransferase
MSKFVIQGPCKLNGEVKVSGSKNAALPIIAATLLAKGKFRITNVPMITDIENMLYILEDLGAHVSFVNHVVEIDTTKVTSTELDEKKVKNMRASILLAGPLLARYGKVELAHPGGCFIGARPIDVTVDGFDKLGVDFTETDDTYIFKTRNLAGNEIVADFSVTGTENFVMAATLAKGTTRIELAACEPHVVNLCYFLRRMGADISGIGTHTLIIKGKKKLKPGSFKIIYDQIEAETFVLAAAASKGHLRIKGFVKEDHLLFLKKIEQANVNFEIIDSETIEIRQTTAIKPVSLQTGVYPGLPTDIQAPFGVLLTQAEGISEIYETIYEGRLNYLNELNKMGADCIIKNSHEAIISGPTPLYGTTIESYDLRAGATLLIASFIADGESTIERAELIDRGYEKIDERLNALGANIVRVED